MDTPVYTSKSTVKSLWQEYRIYDDRVVFETHFGKLTIPLELEIEGARSQMNVEMAGRQYELKDYRIALEGIHSQNNYADIVDGTVLVQAQRQIQQGIGDFLGGGLVLFKHGAHVHGDVHVLAGAIPGVNQPIRKHYRHQAGFQRYLGDHRACIPV